MNRIFQRLLRRGRRPAQGFSLVEVLVVTSMLGVCSLSLIGVFAYGYKLTGKTKQVTMATQVAQVQVERLRNTDYDAIPIVTGTPTALASTDYPFLYADGGACILHNAQQTVTVAQGIDENLKRLDVAIIWDYQGRRMRKDVVTYIAKDGISRR
jgi:prepilin-type N-terminal cleavage/methylation domain-containing protein